MGAARVIARAAVAGVVLVLSVIYVWPGHPSAGSRGLLHIASHIGFFSLVGLALAWTFAGRRWVFVALAVLAALLEVIQWRVIGFAHLEWDDVASNEAGVMLAWIAFRYLLQCRSTHPGPTR